MTEKRTDTRATEDMNEAERGSAAADRIARDDQKAAAQAAADGPVRRVTRMNSETGYPETVDLKVGDPGYDNISPSELAVENANLAAAAAEADAKKADKAKA